MKTKFSEFQKSILCYRYYENHRYSNLLRGGTFYSPIDSNIDYFDKKSKNYIENLGGENKVNGKIDFKNPFILKTDNGWLHEAFNKWNYKKTNWKNIFNETELKLIEELAFSKYDEDIFSILEKIHFIPDNSKKLIKKTQNDTNKIYCVFDFLISNKLKSISYDILLIEDKNDKVKEIFDFMNLFFEN